MNDQQDECGALWYHGDPREKHVCHRPRRHRGSHHADSGLAWARDPHHRSARMTTEPCADCEPVEAGH